MKKDVLRDYLEQIRLLESDIYTMNETISLLQVRKKMLPNYSPPHKPILVPTKDAEIPSVVGTVAGTLAWGLLTWPAIPYLGYRIHKTAKAVKKHKDELNRNQASFERAMAQYNVDSDQYEKEYALAVQNVELFNTNLDKQIATVEANRSATEEVLFKLYDLDIIYRKYRSLVPISMFCEYLDSGIRDELHGANGMYDLYEQQILGKQIVGELSTVNDNLRTVSRQLGSISAKLTGIQQNQVLLYEEVARGNAIASKIQESTEQMLSICDTHLTSIQNATEMTAFHTEATARRTDAMARMAEYEFAAKHSPYIGI